MCSVTCSVAMRSCTTAAPLLPMSAGAHKLLLLLLLQESPMDVVKVVLSAHLRSILRQPEVTAVVLAAGLCCTLWR